MAHYQSQSPPPLRHPVPTHPAYIPEPPSTPSSPQGYQRFSSSPAPPNQTAAQPSYPSHVPAYSAPYHHQQPPLQPQDHMGQSYHSEGNPHNGFQPDFGAWGIDGATAQLGMQLGQSAVTAGQNYVQKNFGTIFPRTTLKHHFNVTNSYVMHKIMLVLFPWKHRSWKRRTIRTEQEQHELQPPRDDINSPDLYIPVMAIVTYVLLAGLYAGLKGSFKPQLLGDTASRATLVVLFDFLSIKLGFYILNVQGANQFVDIFAYSGYKFVGVIFTRTLGFLGLSGPLRTLIFLYAFCANAFFMVRSLRPFVIPDSSNPSPTGDVNPAETVHPAQRRRRVALLFLVAVAQILYMGVLVRLPAA